VRRLRDAGCEVTVAMTDNAQRFVGAQTFQALSHRPVRTSLWDEHAEAAMGHLELARWARQVVIAPATANTIAKLSHGMADDLVSTLCLASTAPIAIAPAVGMHVHHFGWFALCAELAVLSALMALWAARLPGGQRNGIPEKASRPRVIDLWDFRVLKTALSFASRRAAAIIRP
jgi:hypothetical protein